MRLANLTYTITFLLAATAARSDVEIDIRLPLGTVQMAQKNMSPRLHLTKEAEKLTFESAYFPEVEALSGNSFLIFLASGEFKCPGFYIWVTFDETGLHASPEFGSCSDRGEVLRTPQGLMLVMPDPASSRSASYFLNIDGTVTENKERLRSVGIVDPF